MPQAPVIMIIRHAEKPTQGVAGVTEEGQQSSHDLIIRGWQRAGALACFFAPSQGPMQNPTIVKPQFLFASKASNSDKTSSDQNSANGDESKSHRPEETIKPLAQKLQLETNLNFVKGQEKELAKAALACSGPVLIAWQHEAIYDIAKEIPGGNVAPQKWPGDRFDMIFVFTLDEAKDAYNFAQVPQCLLSGDSSKLI